MTRIQKILLPFALLLGACDPADADVSEAKLAADDGVVAPNADGKGKRGGRLARLDADKDGAISLAEAGDTRLAAKFDKLDRDADGKLTRDELRAMKGDRKAGKHGKHGGKRMRGEDGRRGGEGHALSKDPAARTAKLLERRDADRDGSLSAAELQGSRVADKLATLDTDNNGAVSRDELVAFKTAHARRDAR